MTGLDSVGGAIAWAWQVLAKPVIARGGSALQFTIAASIMVSARVVKAIGSGVMDAIESVASKKLRAMGAKYDAEVEEAKAQVNEGRKEQLEEVRVRNELALVGIKEAEARRIDAEIALQAAKAKTEVAQAQAVLVKARAEAKKSLAEAEAIKNRSLIEAIRDFYDTASMIKQQDGSVAFSEESLRQFLALIPTLPEPIRSEIKRKLKELPDAERKSDGGDASESAAGE